MHDHIALLEPIKKRLSRRKLHRPSGGVSVKPQAGGIDLIDELVETNQVDRSGHAIQRGLGQSKLLQQKVGQKLRTARRHLQPQGLTVMALLKALAQRGSKVFHLFLVHRQIGVARQSKL